MALDRSRPHSNSSRRLLLCVLVAAMLSAACGEREATSPPMLVIAVGQPGSVLNAVGTGIATLVTERTGTEMRVRVTSGMDAIVGAGDAELGVSASDSAHLASNGLRQYEGRPQKRLRLALPGPPLITGFIVRDDAPYRTLDDLKGLALPGEYPNARPMHDVGRAMLSTVGMTWDDVEVVPVASFRDGIQAFIEGRTEAANGSVGSGLIQQADANLGGVRFLPLPDREDVSELMWNEEPGIHAVRVQAGFAVGIDEAMILGAKETYLTTNADVSADVVYEIVALLWKHVGDLSSVHPLFERWTREDMANARVTIPYHEGTIRFLKEVRAWTPELERVQRELLARLAN